MSETENRAVARLAPRARTREMLSPAALVEAFSRRTPFSFSFEKFSAPSGDDANTADEDADVAARNAAVSGVLHEPRVFPRGQLSVAEWDEGRGAARVRKKSGKHWETFGHTESGVATSMVLWPEEALFLVECNHLRLLLREVPVSVSEAFALCLDADKGCSFSEYTAFSNLVRMGFRVRRHLDRRRGQDRVSRRSKPVRGDRAIVVEVDDDDDDDDGIQIVCEEEMARSRALSMFPNLIGRTKMGLTAPSVELLPPGSWPKRSSYTMEVARTPDPDIGVLKSAAALIGRKSEVPTWVKTWVDFRKYSAEKSKRGKKSVKRKAERGKRPFPSKRKVLRGGDGDAECDAQSEPPMILPKREPLLRLDEGPLAAIWKGRTKPLLEPRDASDTQAIMERIRLTPPSTVKTGGEGDDDDDADDIVYDVYAPGGRFKKTDPGDPDFHLTVVDAGDGEVPKLGGAASGSVPLLVAFVSPAGSVAFYNFTEISLPKDITMG